MTSQTKPMQTEQSIPKDSPHYWKVESDQRMEEALAEFREKNKGKTWDDLFREHEAAMDEANKKGKKA